ncbi:MAG: NAD(P)H dehydrogenase (quinone) [Chloroflexi bacterium]|nr:MAG: NAD(P)H dehydrogenase (quinone) [Chloroflexota bacterium]
MSEQPRPIRVLVIYDSRGETRELARAVLAGIGEVAGAEPWERPLEEAQKEDLLVCDALILGSPNWSGITGKLKDWLDHTGDLWETGELAGKVGGCFTAGWSRSGGTEATLLQLLHLLLAHGLVFVGLPWSETMRESGSYYGATAHGEVRAVDRAQARALGRRVAEVAVRLGKERPSQAGGVDSRA